MAKRPTADAQVTRTAGSAAGAAGTAGSAAGTAGAAPPPRVRRPVGRPPDSDSADTRQRLLTTAISCFAARGLARTTLREISDAAGLTSGTLYFHFATKEALYIAAYEMAVDQMYVELEVAIEGLDGLIERLEAVLDRAGELMIERPEIQGMVLRAWVEHIDLESLPLPILPRVTEFIDRLVNDAIRRREIQRRHADDLRDLYRTMMWGISAVAPVRSDDIASAIAGLKLLLRDELLPHPR